MSGGHVAAGLETGGKQETGMGARGKLLVVVLGTLMTAQCAAVRTGAVQAAPPGWAAENGRAMLEAARKIPAGSRVSLALTDGRRFKAVLLAVEDRTLVVQQRTRLPEPPLRVDPGEIAYLELDAKHAGFGKMIAIGAAIGTGVTLAFLAVLAATLSD